jgi:hypothetical protein
MSGLKNGRSALDVIEPPGQPGLTAPPARLGPPGGNSPGTGPLAADDRGSCKGPHQTAAGLSYASGPASSADLTAGQRAQVKVPGERTRESALDTSPPANRSAAVSPMGGSGGTQGPQPSPLIEADSGTARSGRRGHDPGALRHGVRSACDSDRPTTDTHGQSWSLDGCGHESV